MRQRPLPCEIEKQIEVHQEQCTRKQLRIEDVHRKEAPVDGPLEEEGAGELKGVVEVCGAVF
jgi:hypothetical protein